MVQATIQSVSKFTAEDDARAGAVQRAGLRMQAVLGTVRRARPLAGRAAHRRLHEGAAVHGLLPHRRRHPVPLRLLRRLRRHGERPAAASAPRRPSTSASRRRRPCCCSAWRRSGRSRAPSRASPPPPPSSSSSPRARCGCPRRPRAFPCARLVPYMIAVGVYALLLNLALNYDVSLLQHFAGEVDGARARRRRPLPGAAHAGAAALPGAHRHHVRDLPARLALDLRRGPDATRAYVTQTLRYALLVAGAMGLVLAARPAALLAILYKPEYGVGAAALPVLVAASAASRCSAWPAPSSTPRAARARRSRSWPSPSPSARPPPRSSSRARRPARPCSWRPRRRRRSAWRRASSRRSSIFARASAGRRPRPSPASGGRRGRIRRALPARPRQDPRPRDDRAGRRRLRRRARRSRASSAGRGQSQAPPHLAPLMPREGSAEGLC